MVRYGAAQIEQLCPQVINAASILSARPKSKVCRTFIIFILRVESGFTFHAAVKQIQIYKNKGTVGQSLHCIVNKALVDCIRL